VKATHRPSLNVIKPGDRPKALIETLSEDVLETFGNARLLDAYDVYQHLMDYWAEKTMQDDLYLIAQAGWIDAAKPRLIVETKEKKSKEQPDFTRREAEIQVGPDPCLIAGRPLFRLRKGRH